MTHGNSRIDGSPVSNRTNLAQRIPWLLVACEMKREAISRIVKSLYFSLLSSD